jgi:tryptophan-rich sensory protein
LAVLAFMMTRAFGRHSKTARLLQYPFLSWLAFATYLNAWAVLAN